MTRANQDVNLQSVNGWKVIETDAEAQELLAHLRDIKGPFGLDTECVVDLDRSPVGQGQIVCWSVAWVDPWQAYRHSRGMRCAHRAFLWLEQLPVFKDWLEDAAIEKVGHNLFTFDRHLFLNHGVNLQGITGDTLRMSRFLNSDSSVDHGLKSLMGRVMGYEPVGEYRQLFARRKFGPVENQGGPKADPHGRDKLTWRKVGDEGRVPTFIGWEHQRLYTATELLPLDTVRTDYPWLLPKLYDYASLDAKATLELHTFFKELMRKRPAKCLGNPKEQTFLELYESWWNPALMQLTEWERAGVDLDPDYCAKAVESIDRDLAPIQARVEAWAPGVNWRSAPQYKAFLYQRKRFKVPSICGSKFEAAKRTPRSKQPGDYVALMTIADYPTTSAGDKAGLRDVATMKKLINERRFAADLPGFRSSLDGRLHCVLAPEADTGRLSAKTPALQQIPKADRYKIRRAFVAPPGHKLIIADYSQLEMYVAAHFMKVICHDDTLELLLASGDMHSAMALRAWSQELKGLRAEDIKGHPDQAIRDRRDHAKAVGYGLFYGKGAAGMGVSIRRPDGSPIGTLAAEGILDAYHAAVPALAKLQSYFKEYAREHWGIHTLLGRFRPLPEVNSDDEWTRGEGERAALNTPIQGSAHDIVTTAMLHLNTSQLPDLVRLGYYNSKLASCGAVGILQVHDELQFRVPADRADEAAAIVKDVMANPFEPGVFSVQLRADVHVVDSWGHAK